MRALAETEWLSMQFMCSMREKERSHIARELAKIQTVTPLNGTRNDVGRRSIEGLKVPREMAEMSELHSENADNTQIEEHPKEGFIRQDDYNTLVQEIENYRQRLYVMTLKLKANDAIRRDLETSNEILYETYLRNANQESTRKEATEMCTADKKEYENRIAVLEKNIEENEEEIKRLRKELKECKYLLKKEPLTCQSAQEEALIPYKKDIMRLNSFLYVEKRNVNKLKAQLEKEEDLKKELNNNFHMVSHELKEKKKALEDTQKSVTELTAKIKELELSKVTPASDTCKGNSLFAEVEDRRQMLVDRMRVLANKYTDAKQMLNTKTAEVKVLRIENMAIARNWQVDAIDTLQENADLLDEYKKRIFELENKLKVEMKKNNQEKELRFIGDNFSYARSLILAKGQEINELNEKLEKQALQMLVQEEANNDISRQLRFWRSKTRFFETQMLEIKEQLEKEQTNGNKTLIKTIENCIVQKLDTKFKDTCDDSKLTPDVG